MNKRVDHLGSLASCLCAAHCASCALLPATLSALGVGVLLTHEVEWVLTLVAIAFALGSAVINWRHTRSPLVVGLLVVGIIGLLASRIVEMNMTHHHDEHQSSSLVMEHRDQHEVAIHQPTDKHNLESMKDSSTQRSDHGDFLTHHGEVEHHGQLHVDSEHLLGMIISVISGLCLCFGHLLNIRISKQQVEPACCA